MTTFFNDHKHFNDPAPEGHHFRNSGDRLQICLTLEPKGDNAAVWVHTYLNYIHVGANQVFSGPAYIAEDIVSGKIVFTDVDPRTNAQMLRCSHFSNLMYAETGEAVRCR